MKKGKLRRLIRSHKKELFLFVLLLIFPLVVGMIYAIPIPQIVMVEAGDLLSFYGVAFGLIGSFVVYSDKKRKEIESRCRELQPKLRTELRLVDEEDGIFEMTVYNDTPQPLQTIFLYDCYAQMNLQCKEIFYVAFQGVREKEYNNKRLFDIDIGEQNLDADGYPKYIQICCDDAEKRMWNCIFDLRRSGNDRFYYPSTFSIE